MHFKKVMAFFRIYFLNMNKDFLSMVWGTVRFLQSSVIFLCNILYMDLVVGDA